MAKRERPRFEPTEEQRRNGEIMTGLGIPQTNICLMVRGPKGKPISLTTLEKHFRKEIDTGATNLRTRVGNFVITTIMGTKPPEGFAPITDEKVRGSLLELFAAAQLNWRKTVRQEHANADGKPFVYVANKTDAIEPVSGIVIDPGRTSAAHPNTQGGNNADASARLHRRVGVFGRSSDRGCSPIRAKRLDARLAANRPAREASLR